MATLFWGIVGIIAGWWLLKFALAFIGAGLGLLFGKYQIDEKNNVVKNDK